MEGRKFFWLILLAASILVSAGATLMHD